MACSVSVNQSPIRPLAFSVKGSIARPLPDISRLVVPGDWPTRLPLSFRASLGHTVQQT